MIDGTAHPLAHRGVGIELVDIQRPDVRGDQVPRTELIVGHPPPRRANSLSPRRPGSLSLFTRALQAPGSLERTLLSNVFTTATAPPRGCCGSAIFPNTDCCT